MAEQHIELEDPSVTIGTEVAMFSISMIGLLFNGLVVYITLFRHRSRHVAIWIMAFIAMLDIGFSLTVIATQISKWVTLHQVLTNQWFCQYSGLVYMLSVITSIDAVGVLSLIRCIAIVYNTSIKGVYWYTTIGLLLIFNTIFSIFGVIYEIMRVMPSQAYCQPSFRKNSFSKIYSIVIMGKFFLMLFIVIASYILITIKYCKLLSAFNSKSNATKDCSVGTRPTLVFQRGVIIRLVALVFMYMLCFLPELLTLVYNLATNTQRDPVADAISGVTMNLTILVNSVFVLFYHEETQSILISLLPRWIYRTNSNADIFNSSDFKINTDP
jgi:hypothetical protein